LADVETQRAVRYALSHPPALFNRHYPTRPATPWLAQLWDQGLTVATAYRHRWQHTQHQSPGPVTHPILGPSPPPGTSQHTDWLAANQILQRIALTIARRQITDTGVDLPATAADIAGFAAWFRSEAPHHVRRDLPWLAPYLGGRLGESRREATAGRAAPNQQ
jgi:hypothetical protein